MRFADVTRAQLRPVYGDIRLDQAELEIQSVPWDISPSLRQEPTLHPSFGVGDAAPGTLLHSGEMTASTTDLAIRGRGFDFAFTRTYRSGIVGGGPLGPGIDHGYRQRLRPLPNGDVEYFDGRGRREVFELEDLGAAGKRYRATGRFVDLARTTTGWVIVDSHGNVVRFDDHGRLASMADAAKALDSLGNEMFFLYDLASRLSTVVDTLGRSISLIYDDDGQLTKIRDFSGREFLYDYDALGRLERVRTPPVVTIERQGVAERLETLYSYKLPEGDLAQQLNQRNNCFTTTEAKGQTWLSLTWGDADNDGYAEEVTNQVWGAGTVGLDYTFAANRQPQRGLKSPIAGVTSRSMSSTLGGRPCGSKIRPWLRGHLPTTKLKA